MPFSRLHEHVVSHRCRAARSGVPGERLSHRRLTGCPSALSCMKGCEKSSQAWDWVEHPPVKLRAGGGGGNSGGPHSRTATRADRFILAADRCRFSLSGLVERLELDDGGLVVVAHPEGHRSRRVFHEHPADVGLARKKIFGDLGSFRIEAQYPVVVLTAAPRLAILVHGGIVRIIARRGRSPFLESLRLCIEHPDTIPTVLAKPEPSLGVHHA